MTRLLAGSELDEASAAVVATSHFHLNTHRQSMMFLAVTLDFLLKHFSFAQVWSSFSMAAATSLE